MTEAIEFVTSLSGTKLWVFRARSSVKPSSLFCDPIRILSCAAIAPYFWRFLKFRETMLGLCLLGVDKSNALLVVVEIDTEHFLPLWCKCQDDLFLVIAPSLLWHQPHLCSRNRGPFESPIFDHWRARCFAWPLSLLCCVWSLWWRRLDCTWYHSNCRE